MGKKISVAIATYNGERFLSEQLESIVHQTCSVDEIVISDDCSEDNTLNVIHHYEVLYPDILWKININKTNLGFRKNFRKAISKCTGDIIFLCDQDDIWMLDKIEKMLKVFDNNPQIMTLVSDFKTINSEGKLLQPNKKLENIVLPNRVVNSKCYLEKIKIYEAFPHSQGQGCTMAITSEVAKLYLKCNLDWAHDNLVGLIAAFRGGLYYMKEQLIYYRLHGNNTLGMPIGKWGNRYSNIEDNILTFMSVWKYCYLKKTGEECREEIFNKRGNLFKEIESVTGCAESEIEDLDKWRKFEELRLNVIRKRKLIRYLILRVKYTEFFKLEVPICTFEQQIVRLATDIGAIIK